MSPEQAEIALTQEELRVLISALAHRMREVGRTMRRARLAGTPDDELLPLWESFDTQLALKERLELLLSSFSTNPPDSSALIGERDPD